MKHFKKEIVLLSHIFYHKFMKKIVIFGASGLIGSQLVEDMKRDYQLVIVTRRPHTLRKVYKDIAVERLRTRDLSKIIKHFEGAAAVINLAGEPVSGRWSEKKMDVIKKSRLDVDSIIVRAFLSTVTRPKVVIQGSAIGIYGYSRMDKDIDETCVRGKRGFLPKVVATHEEMFVQIEKFTRVVYIRTGIVLDKNKGVLPKMALPVKLFAGGKFGSGKQWMSWIHIKDEARAIRFLMEKENSNGAYNLTAPNPVINKDFSSALSKVLGKPSLCWKPAFLLKLFLGKMADELLLKGLKVLPSKLLKEGFDFKYTDLGDALNDIYKD